MYGKRVWSEGILGLVVLEWDGMWIGWEFLGNEGGMGGWGFGVFVFGWWFVGFLCGGGWCWVWGDGCVECLGVLGGFFGLGVLLFLVWVGEVVGWGWILWGFVFVVGLLCGLLGLGGGRCVWFGGGCMVNVVVVCGGVWSGVG